MGTNGTGTDGGMGESKLSRVSLHESAVRGLRDGGEWVGACAGRLETCGKKRAARRAAPT